MQVRAWRQQYGQVWLMRIADSSGLVFCLFFSEKVRGPWSLLFWSSLDEIWLAFVNCASWTLFSRVDILKDKFNRYSVADFTRDTGK
jgi:hypothetical protein